MLTLQPKTYQDIYCMPDIKKKIKECGFTTQQIAEKLNISQQAVSQAINGNPTLSRLQDIADAIGISVSELVSDEPQPQENEAVFTIPKDVKKVTINIE